MGRPPRLQKREYVRNISGDDGFQVWVTEYTHPNGQKEREIGMGEKEGDAFYVDGSDLVSFILTLQNIEDKITEWVMSGE